MLFEPHALTRPMTILEEQIVDCSLSYVVVDTFMGLYGKYNDFWMNVHHIVMFSAFVNAYIK